jgi:hypothetical protein
MTIEVKEEQNGSFTISWDENDPQESILNHYTEEDFIRVITEYLSKMEEEMKDGNV